MQASAIALGNEEEISLIQGLITSGLPVYRDPSELGTVEVSPQPLSKSSPLNISTGRRDRGEDKIEHEANTSNLLAWSALRAIRFTSNHSPDFAKPILNDTHLPGLIFPTAWPMIANRYLTDTALGSRSLGETIRPTFESRQKDLPLRPIVDNKDLSFIFPEAKEDQSRLFNGQEFTPRPINLSDDISLLPPTLIDFIKAAIESISQALGKGYIALTDSLQDYLRFTAGIVDPILNPLNISFSQTVLSIDFPEGPRTPSVSLPLLGTSLNGDNNTMKFIDIANLSLMASISRKGDPSDPKPDDNDLPGQLEANAGGLLIGTNFQNGLYVGEFFAETSESEAHHFIQTGMVDQSGTYLFGERSDSTNFIALSPEKDPGQLVAGDLSPVELSIEGISEFINAAQEGNAFPETRLGAYDDLLQSALESIQSQNLDLGSLDPRFTAVDEIDPVSFAQDLSTLNLLQFAGPIAPTDSPFTLATVSPAPIASIAQEFISGALQQTILG